MARVKTSVRIEGIEEAVRTFRRAPGVAKKYVKAATAIAEGSLLSAVVRAAPRDTGALRQSLASRLTGLIASIYVEPGHGYRLVGPDVYWRFVEYGTIHVAARPFVRPSAEAATQPYIDELKKALARLARDLDRF